MRGEKSKYSLEFYVSLSVTIENICKQITPAAKFAIRARQWQISANFLICVACSHPYNNYTCTCMLVCITCFV